MARLRVAVLGLGEAGATLASGLVDAGCDVRGWDPAPHCRPERVPLARSDRDAIAGADIVLSVNTAAVALDVARGIAPVLTAGQLYADLNTAAPALKRALEQTVVRSGATFADVALLGTVPALGLRTPALASGPGAPRFAELLGPLGMPVEVVGPEPGAAAGRKLVRSVFMKGLAAAILESLAAADACGLEGWLREEIAHVLDGPGEPLVERLVSGSRLHALRRRDEMEAAAEHLASLGVEPRVARAAAAWLEELSSVRLEAVGSPAPRQVDL
jgi:3-hydroxyisobutyrate dehydrogenase-like beta-hydroxyacid dehydrogenase